MGTICFLHPFTLFLRESLSSHSCLSPGSRPLLLVTLEVGEKAKLFSAVLIKLHSVLGRYCVPTYWVE